MTLARKVESNELSLAEVTDATFTVTSLETLGVDAFTPVLNPPRRRSSESGGCAPRRSSSRIASRWGR